MEGEALRVGLGCGGEGGTGPTRVSYLRGVGAGAVGTVAAATATATAMAGVLWLKGGAALVGGGAATAAGSGPRLEPPAGGGEEGLTLGLWLCPPRDLAMLRLEKERRWREREEEDFCFEGKEMM